MRRIKAVVIGHTVAKVLDAVDADILTVNQGERELLMNKVKQDGFVGDYRRIRIASSGRRFWIDRPTIWNVVDETGNYQGAGGIVLPGKVVGVYVLFCI